jgi:hypothetical protein
VNPATVELLVPAKDRTRAAIDRQLDAYGGLGRRESPGDVGRAAGLFELVASTERDLAIEIAKVEHGLAPHILRLQFIVLRYEKALLAFLTTSIAVFAASAVVTTNPTVTTNGQLWLAAVLLIWAPAVAGAVSSPVRWIDALQRSEGAISGGIGRDRNLTQVERISMWIATSTWTCGAVAAILTTATGNATSETIAIGVTTMITGVALGKLWLDWQNRTTRSQPNRATRNVPPAPPVQ